MAQCAGAAGVARLASRPFDLTASAKTGSPETSVIIGPETEQRRNIAHDATMVLSSRLQAASKLFGKREAMNVLTLTAIQRALAFSLHPAPPPDYVQSVLVPRCLAMAAAAIDAAARTSRVLAVAKA